MIDYNIILPSKPRVVLEEESKGIYEIDGLYPGYGYTLGNSLRRIILSSLPGAAITSIKIEGVPHEFSTIEGVKEDVITMILNLKKIRFKLASDEPQTVTLQTKGAKIIKAGDIKIPGQMEILNKDLFIGEITGKGTVLNIEMIIEKGLGFVQKENFQKGKVEIGTIALDAIFSPIRRVSYEVEYMRVGERTNHNRLRFFIETDGTISPREALAKSIALMISQLKAILDIKEESPAEEDVSPATPSSKKESAVSKEDMTDALKTRVDTLNLSTRTLNALNTANIRTLGGLARKKASDLLLVEGMGEKGLQEIRKILSGFDISLKE